MENEQIQELSATIKKDIVSTVLNESKLLFDKKPELVSFGWKQFTTKGGASHTKKYSVYHTINTPDVNGADGTKFNAGVDQTTRELQKAVFDTVAQFDTEMLLLAFGDDCEISVYKDLTYEVSQMP